MCWGRASPIRSTWTTPVPTWRLAFGRPWKKLDFWENRGVWFWEMSFFARSFQSYRWSYLGNQSDFQLIQPPCVEAAGHHAWDGGHEKQLVGDGGYQGAHMMDWTFRSAANSSAILLGMARDVPRFPDSAGMLVSIWVKSGGNQHDLLQDAAREITGTSSHILLGKTPTWSHMCVCT